MIANFYFKNLSTEEEKFFSEYIEEKMPAIETLLTKFSQDSKIFKAGIEKFDKHDAYEVELSLSLPTKNIIAKETSHDINKAVDLSKDRLVTQIKKHMANLRKDRSQRSIRDVVEEVPTGIEVEA